jgi:hypothetical protein
MQIVFILCTFVAIGDDNKVVVVFIVQTMLADVEVARVSLVGLLLVQKNVWIFLFPAVQGQFLVKVLVVIAGVGICTHIPSVF